MENSTGTETILVVSCDNRFIQLARNAFNEAIPAYFADNEADAVELIRDKDIDAVLIGFIEPQESSAQVQETIREESNKKKIPMLIARTGEDADPTEGCVFEKGITVDSDDFIRLSGVDSEGLSRLLEPTSLSNILNSFINKAPLDFREAITNKNQFCVTWEQIAGKGATEEQQELLVKNSIKVMNGRMVNAVSVTDNPGGNPALSTEMMCSEIKKLGVDPLVHLASRDKNRNQMESMLYGLSVAGLSNLLILSGDAPSNAGYLGKSKPVFDLDPIQTLQLIQEMNAGLEFYEGKKKKTLKPANFFAGVSVSPFKKTEAELMGQYYKLEKKLKAGAAFIVNQVGFDARKWHEVLQWLKLKDHDIPVMANIYVMGSATAKIMNKNMIPGCVVTDKMLADILESEKAEDKGKSWRLEQASKMYAIARGMGFAGVHIGGHNLTYEMVQQIICEGEKIAPKWHEYIREFDYPQENGFYYFEKDPATGLNTSVPAVKGKAAPAPFTYRLSRLMHWILFIPDTARFRFFQSVARWIDKSKGRIKVFHNTEHLIKTALFGCMDCGDCALPDVAYLCPMSQCPKSQRNGPCGGSYDGWCEVYPNERKCVWVRAYDRLKAYGEEDTMAENITEPSNWDLWEKPSWINFLLGRDHTAKRLGVKPPEVKK